VRVDSFIVAVLAIACPRNDEITVSIHSDVSVRPTAGCAVWC
jgi:hypothetical protein